jgi:tetratricopeptide (TPR) repeat protein
MKWMVAVVLMLGVSCSVVVQAQEAESFFQEAVQAAQAGAYDTALARFEAALQADPNNLRYGNAYRLTVVKINQVKTYDRCTAFFQRLVASHPRAPNAWLHLGYAYVDKIPVEGAITQVLLANKALGQFSAALALEENWLGLYTRGNSYVYWPAIFGRTPLAIADLEKAIALSQQTTRRSYHARAYVALGDAYWRLSDLEKARHIWRQALQLFPDDQALQTRLAPDDTALQALLTAHFEPGKRVDTNVSGIWAETELPVPVAQDDTAVLATLFEAWECVDISVSPLWAAGAAFSPLSLREGPDGPAPTQSRQRAEGEGLCSSTDIPKAPLAPLRGRRERSDLHPNPLPEGEGTERSSSTKG